jgi:predicted Zn-ribbon and HTH transcriptional regulator
MFLSSYKNEVLEALNGIRLTLSRLGDEMILVRMKELQGHVTVKEKPLRGEQYVPGKVIFTDPSLREELSKRRKVEETIREIGDIVSCESCGCLLKKETARKGEAEVRVQKLSQLGSKDEEYIYHPYFCNKCGDETEEEEIEVGCDTFCSDWVNRSSLTACSSVVDSPEAQLKRAERDVLLGQAELLRQQAESIRIDNAAKRPPKAGA